MMRLFEEGPTLETLDFDISFLYRQYSNFFIFRFVSRYFLRRTLRLFH